MHCLRAAARCRSRAYHAYLQETGLRSRHKGSHIYFRECWIQFVKAISCQRIVYFFLAHCLWALNDIFALSFNELWLSSLVTLQIQLAAQYCNEHFSKTHKLYSQFLSTTPLLLPPQLLRYTLPPAKSASHQITVFNMLSHIPLNFLGLSFPPNTKTSQFHWLKTIFSWFMGPMSDAESPLALLFQKEIQLCLYIFHCFHLLVPHLHAHLYSSDYC